MTEIRIGYARCSTDCQDLAAQQEALVGLGVSPDRIYTDKGLTGSNRQRPGLVRRWRRFARETRWSYRNWTGWPVQFRMQEKLLMPFRPVA
ncbi:recombinase family protein [Enterobacteriaceae bacterium YMB-R22]|jgi:hypothetical protein|nr:recombinase family protein [Tenebrionicola larvae]